jgi:hypothetical protein
VEIEKRPIERFVHFLSPVSYLLSLISCLLSPASCLLVVKKDTP